MRRGLRAHLGVILGGLWVLAVFGALGAMIGWTVLFAIV